MVSIILVSPQMGENIGAAARVMMNFGFSDLRVVTPRDGWPNPAAVTMAAGGACVVEQAQVFDCFEAAISDLSYLYAVTARKRDLAKACITPRESVTDLPCGMDRVGLVFGPEKDGLSNTEVALCDAIVSIPVSHSYGSLNLAQAVAVLCYEWSLAIGNGVMPDHTQVEPAERDALVGFLTQLELLLEEKGHFKDRDLKDTMTKNMRSMFVRAGFSAQEIATLWGVVKTLIR